MIEYRWYAVRCCCKPTKIFGYLKVRSEIETTRKCNIRGVDGEPMEVELRRFGNQIMMTGECLEQANRIAINAAVRDRCDELAIPSKDMPIEYWRQVPGFVEAVPGVVND